VTLEPSQPEQVREEIPEPPGAPPTGRPSREYRATVAFTIGGLFALIVALLLFGNVLQVVPPIRGALVLGGALLGTVAMLAAAYGLASGRGWAIVVATPMLLLLVLAGVIEVVEALTHNTIDIPLGALLAVWALLAPVRTPVDPTQGSRTWGVAGTLVLAAMVVSTAWPIVSPLLLQSGGPFVVAEDALQPSLFLTCNGAPDAPPTSVTIRYDWRWSRTEPWAAGTDTITLVAYSSVEEDGSASYVLEGSTQGSAGTWQSDIMISEPQGVVFGIDLTQAGFEPGSVGIGLQPAGPLPSGPGSIDVQATYLHAPIDTSGPNAASAWRVRSQMSCEW
jgi:hypothetical protein